jgi:hypothetical protein
MLVTKFDNEEQWLAARPTNITGTKLKDITPKARGAGRKIGFYQLAADFLGVQDGSVDGRDRGKELEAEGVAELSKLVGVEFETDLVMWQSDENPNMAYSPDGYTKDLIITAELKHFGSARHLEIIDTNKIPADNWLQVIQSFIVNEKQQEHYFASRDPRITAKPIWYKKTLRKDIEDQIKLYRDIEEQVLIDVMEFVERLAF